MSTTVKLYKQQPLLQISQKSCNLSTCVVMLVKYYLSIQGKDGKANISFGILAHQCPSIIY